MTALVRAELLKLRSTRLLRWMAAATLVIVALNVALNVAGAGRGDAPPLTTAAGVEQVFAAAATGMTLTLVVGIVLVAGELRHGTSTGTFLVTPDRARVLRAKAVAAALAGGAFAVSAIVLTVAIAVPWLAAEDAVGASATGVSIVLGASALLTIAAGVMGVGIGALVRNQTAAVGLALGWVLVLDALVAELAPSVGRWLLNGATSALMASTGALDRADAVSRSTGLVLVTAYTVGALLLGAWRLRRSDV